MSRIIILRNELQRIIAATKFSVLSDAPGARTRAARLFPPSTRTADRDTERRIRPDIIRMHTQAYGARTQSRGSEIRCLTARPLFTSRGARRYIPSVRNNTTTRVEEWVILHIACTRGISSRRSDSDREYPELRKLTALPSILFPPPLPPLL